MKRIKSVLVKVWAAIKSSKKWQTILSSILAVVIGGAGFAVGYSVGNKSQEVKDESSSEEEGSSEEDSFVGDEEEKVPSGGLEYKLSEDETYYIVTDNGTCKDTKIVIPSTYNGLPVTSIDDSAFWECRSLTEIIIPDSVTSIGDWVFEFCDSLTEIIVDENSVNYSSLDGNLYNKKQTKLIYYAPGKTDTSFTIPDSVTNIGSSAFYNCTSLTSVVIGDSVTSIGNYAFSDCSSLTEVVIGDSVTSVGYRAFDDTGYYNNENNWEDGVLYIGKYLIASKKDIEGKYTIKDGTLCIANAILCAEDGFYYEYEAGAFSSCYSLTEIVIPDSVTNIGDYAFGGCKSLMEVVIPDSVTSIGIFAFSDCSSLTSIQFEGTVVQWVRITKGDDWNYDVPATEVICSDGVVKL